MGISEGTTFEGGMYVRQGDVEVNKRTIPDTTHFRRLRRRAGLSQADASRAVGRSHSHCGFIESGRYKLPTEIFRSYMLAFGAGPFDVLDCLRLNPFDLEVVRRFESHCRKENRDPVRVLETLMRFYVAK